MSFSYVIIYVITNTMGKLKIRQVGNSLGVILPAEILSKLRATEGDEVFVTETPNGVEFSLYNPDVAKQLEVAEAVMKENKEVLKKLAE